VQQLIPALVAILIFSFISLFEKTKNKGYAYVHVFKTINKHRIQPEKINARLYSYAMRRVPFSSNSHYSDLNSDDDQHHPELNLNVENQFLYRSSTLETDNRKDRINRDREGRVDTSVLLLTKEPNGI
jgi:hypothetical protein